MEKSVFALFFFHSICNILKASGLNHRIGKRQDFLHLRTSLKHIYSLYTTEFNLEMGKFKSEGIDIAYGNFYSRLKEQERMDMGFFNRSGKKKEQTKRTEERKPLSPKKKRAGGNPCSGRAVHL